MRLFEDTPRLLYATVRASGMQLRSNRPVTRSPRHKEQPITNSRRHSQEELRRQILAETIIHATDNISTSTDIEHRHNAPIQTALPNEASDYKWKRETGEVQSYQHTHVGSWLHIDPKGQFYDRQAQPIARETALEQARQASAHSLADNALVQSGSRDTTDLGLSL